GAPAFLDQPAPVVAAVAKPEKKAEDRPVIAQVRDLFKRSCSQCHEGSKPEAGLRVFDAQSLVQKKAVDRANPNAAEILTRIKDDGTNAMPPPWSGRPRLKPEEARTVERWIKDGLPPLEEEVASAGVVGDEYVLRTILDDVTKLKRKGDQVENYRYFSL